MVWVLPAENAIPCGTDGGVVSAVAHAVVPDAVSNARLEVLPADVVGLDREGVGGAAGVSPATVCDVLAVVPAAEPSR